MIVFELLKHQDIIRLCLNFKIILPHFMTIAAMINVRAFNYI